MSSLTPLQRLIAQELETTTRKPTRLRGGLILIFYPREGRYSRLVAARKDATPSDVELEVIRRDLVAVLEERPDATVGQFQRLPEQDGFNAAEIYIYFAPKQSEIPLPKETRYK